MRHNVLYMGSDTKDGPPEIASGARIEILVSDAGKGDLEIITMTCKDKTSEELFEISTKVQEKLGFRLLNKNRNGNRSITANWSNSPRDTD